MGRLGGGEKKRIIAIRWIDPVTLARGVPLQDLKDQVNHIHKGTVMEKWIEAKQNEYPQS